MKNIFNMKIMDRLSIPFLIVLSLLSHLAPVIFYDSFSFNSDEAVMGLMGLHGVKGHFPFFYYGQAYGGGFEQLLITLYFAVLPATLPVLRLAAATLLLATDFIFYKVLNLVFPENVRIRNLCMLAFLAISPTYFYLLSRPWGTHLNNVFIFISLIFILAKSNQLLSRPILFGLLLGVGAWVSPVVLMFLLPLLFLYACKDQRKDKWKIPFKSAVQFFPAFLLGALPRVIYYLLPNDWYDAYKFGGKFVLGNFAFLLKRSKDVLVNIFPEYLFGGLLHTELSHWFFVLYILLWISIFITTFNIRKLFLHNRLAASLVGAIAIIFFETVLAAICNQLIVDSGIRYFFAMQFYLAICATGLGLRRENGSYSYVTLAQIVVGIAVILSGLIGRVYLPYEKSRLEYAEVSSLIQTLKDDGARIGTADYWLAYSINFRTQDAITLLPFYTDRIVAYHEPFARAKSRVWIYDWHTGADPENRNLYGWATQVLIKQYGNKEKRVGEYRIIYEERK
jgi:hypothetical protein